MAANADSVVVELLAKVDQFDQPVKQSAAKFNQSMDQIAASAAKAETAVQKSSTGSASAIERQTAQVMQFGRQLGTDMATAGDLLAGPTSPFVMPVKQAPAVISAVEGVTTSLGVLGGVVETLTGVGIALLIASFVEMFTRGKQAEGGIDDLVQKLKEHHEQTIRNNDAQALYDRTVEGSIEKADKLTAALDSQNRTLDQNVRLKQAEIAANLGNVLSNIATTEQQIAKAAIEYRDALRVVDDIQSGKLQVGENPAAALISAQTGAQNAKQHLADLTGQLNLLRAAAERSSSGLLSVGYQLVERNAKNAVNPVAAINTKYDEMATKAKRAGTYTQELADSIERMRQADLKATQQRSSSASAGSGEFGRTVSFADASSIARGAGLRVTSAYRSTTHQAELYNDPAYNHPGNPVARPGTSAHEGINGKWALDIAFAPGLTADKLKKLYGDEGVKLTAIYKETGHFHIEGNRTQAEIGADREVSAQQKEQLKFQQKWAEAAEQGLQKEVQVTVVKDEQRDLYANINQHAEDLNDLLESGTLPGLRQGTRQLDQMLDSMREFASFGEQELETLLNPGNWNNWGDLGKRVLRDLGIEILKLGALNPLKNLLFGESQPTLLSVFTGLFNGGASLGTAGKAHAAGGLISGPGSSTSDSIPAMLSDGEFVLRADAVRRIGLANLDAMNQGRARMFSEGGAVRSISPANDIAMSPLTRLGVGDGLRIEVSPSQYFDVRVQRVAAPMVAEGSVRAAQGGSLLARQGLGRSALHRLE